MKYFTLASVALACSLTAAAATPTMQKQSFEVNTNDFTTMNVTSAQAIDINNEASSAKKVIRKAKSIDDICGPYNVSFRFMLNSALNGFEPGWNTKTMMLIKDETRPNTIIFSGLMGNYTFTGTYDEAKGTISIETQDFFFIDQTGVQVSLTHFDWVPAEEEGYITPVQASDTPFVLHVNGDQLVSKDYNSLAAIDLTDFQGYYFLALGFTFDKVNPWVYNANEWESFGDAEFTDAWFNPLFNEPIPAYTVPAMRNKYKSWMYLLVNPYGPNTPFGEEGLNLDANKNGYILLDIQDPETVLVQPFVYTLTANLGSSDQPDIEPFFAFNLEGYLYYAEGLVLGEIADGLLAEKSDVSYADGQTVYVCNPRFSLGDELLTCYGWVDKNQVPLDAEAEIVFSAPVDDAVEGIVAEEAPAEYYTLQGMKVQNPAKGQIMIVKKGNKVSKKVIR